MISRRAFLTLFRSAAPPPPPPSPMPLPADVGARVARFRAELAGRQGPADGPLLAVVTPPLCLLRMGTGCSVCSERCPVSGALSVDGRAVRIDAARCTGCGHCVDACPAPVPALALRKVLR